MNKPMVTCIMLTANRLEFFTFSISQFLRQDYPNAELVIIDDGKKSFSALIPDTDKIRYFHTHPIGTIGMKRNVACDKANGEYIFYWDDDDFYAPDWISRQVDALSSSSADISGLSSVIFYSDFSNETYRYTYSENNTKWISGATMAFRKTLWERYPFKDLQIGEDADFILNSGGHLVVLEYESGYQARLHGNNTSIKYLKNE